LYLKVFCVQGEGSRYEGPKIGYLPAHLTPRIFYFFVGG